MKETDKKEINVFFRHKIVKENLSVAGVNGYISTACESSRYDGGAVSSYLLLVKVADMMGGQFPGMLALTLPRVQSITICKLIGTVTVLAYTLTTTQIPFNSCHHY
jgi:hypothetical protein